MRPVVEPRERRARQRHRWDRSPDVGAVERREVWIASIPNVFTPADGMAAADKVIAEAFDEIRAVKLSFGGTLPPPPWPAPPELVQAIDRVTGFRDGFEVFSRKAVHARWPKQTGKVGPAFIRAGEQLYYELGRFEARAAKVKSGDTMGQILRALPDPRRLFFAQHPSA